MNRIGRDMSKEMIDLADEIERLAALDAHAGVGALCARNAGTIAAALRASAVAEPVAWTSDRNLDAVKRSPRKAAGIWGEKNRLINVPLYAHPAPAAPFAASDVYTAEEIREADAEADKIHAALFAPSLPAPEAAPTREEIIEQCISIVREMTVKHGSPVGDAYGCGVHDQGVRIEGKLLALKSAPAK